MTEQSYRTSDLSEMFDVHQNTIRSYVDKIPNHLSEHATAARRKYSERDARIIYTVVKMRDIGIDFDDIAVAISEGRIEDSLPVLPSEEEQQARDNVEIVTIPRDTYLVEQEKLLTRIELLQQERDTIKEQLETERTDKRQLQERLTNLERQLGQAQGQLQASIPTRIWIALFIVLIVAVFLLAVYVVTFN